MESPVDVRTLPTSLPSLETLQTQAKNHIANLLLQRRKLGDISTQVTDLINRYNAHKSYLGQAAYWYGEQNWWLQIIIGVLAAGIAILLYIPTIISIALTLVASFLLLNHHHVSKQRDQLISRDLHAQNQSVQAMIQDLEIAKTNLEEKLTVLCKMNQDMCSENIKLRTNIAEVGRQVQIYKKLSEEQIATIQALQSKEQLLNTQLEELQSHLTQYKEMVENSAGDFIQNNAQFKLLTEQLTQDSLQLKQVTSDIVSSSRILGNSLTSSPENIPSKVLKEADLSMDGINSSYLEEVSAKLLARTPPRGNQPVTSHVNAKK